MQESMFSRKVEGRRRERVVYEFEEKEMRMGMGFMVREKCGKVVLNW
jgi:hypothetical protein